MNNNKRIICAAQLLGLVESSLKFVLNADLKKLN
jgi:hypothetical protein